MATAFEKGNALSRYNDQTELTRRYGIKGLTGSLAAQLAQATALLPAIGSTYYQAGLKAYSYANLSVAHGLASVDVVYRTPQPDDLIMTSASGTIIDKGSTADVEDVLRDRHPTSGATFTLGTATAQTIAKIRSSEPRLEWWFDKVHTSLSSIDAAATTILGAINSATWNGYPVGTWLCNSIITRTVHNDAATRYVARYSFVYKPETWVAKETTFIWNGLTLGAITAATKATAAYARFRDANFNSYGFTR